MNTHDAAYGGSSRNRLAHFNMVRDVAVAGKREGPLKCANEAESR